MVTNPIYKDTYYIASGESLEPLSYYVTVDEGTNEIEIFRGKAYEKPNGDAIVINLNKICQNYLNPSIEEFLSDSATTYSDTESSKIFHLYDNSGNELESYKFIYDWSYGESTTLAASKKAYDGRMYKLYGGRDQSSIFKNKSDAYGILSCGDYALYYLTSYGNWDALLVEGNGKKKDTLTRNSISINYDNNTIEFEKRNYNNQIVRSYELHTGWMDDESIDFYMSNLVPSTRVYMHDLNSNKIYPVVITDTVAEHKTYKTEKKMISLTFNIELSQSRQVK